MDTGGVQSFVEAWGLGLADVAQRGFDLTTAVVVVVHDDDTGSVAHHHEFCVIVRATVGFAIDGRFAMAGCTVLGAVEET